MSRAQARRTRLVVRLAGWTGVGKLISRPQRAFHGDTHELSASSHAGAVKQLLNRRLYRAFREPQVFPNLSTCQAGEDAHEDALFPIGEQGRTIFPTRRRGMADRFIRQKANDARVEPYSASGSHLAVQPHSMSILGFQEHSGGTELDGNGRPADV